MTLLGALRAVVCEAARVEQATAAEPAAVHQYGWSGALRQAARFRLPVLPGGGLRFDAPMAVAAPSAPPGEPRR